MTTLNTVPLVHRMQVVVEELKHFPTVQECMAVPYWQKLLEDARFMYGGLAQLQGVMANLAQETYVDFPNQDQRETTTQIAEKDRLLIRDSAGSGKTAPAVHAKYALEQIVHVTEGKSGPSGKGTRPGYAKILTDATYHFMLDQAPRLKRYLYVEDSSEVPIENERLRNRLFAEELRKIFEEAGYQVRAVKTPVDFFTEIVRHLRTRADKEVKQYLSRAESRFLDGFPIDQLRTQADAEKVVAWLRVQDKPQDLDFLARCLVAKYRDKLDQNTDFTWLFAASSYEFVRADPWTRDGLPQKIGAEELALSVTRHFIENPKEYHRGDAPRLMAGLYLMGRTQGIKDMMAARMNVGLPVNYLVLNYLGIDSLVQTVINRIRANEVANADGEYRDVYKSIRRDTFAVTPGTIDALKLAIDTQFHPSEKDTFENMRTIEEKSVTPSYRRTILRYYLLVKGQDVLKR